MKQTDYVKLANLGHGAAMEMFQEELSKAIKNIHDPATKPEAMRSVTLVLKLKPSKDRSMAVATIDCDAKLAKVLPFETTMFTGVDRDGNGVASELTQAEMFGDPTVTTDDGETVNPVTGEKVVAIGGGKK